MTQPRPDEVEVTIFGPGYGECVLVHFGSGKWGIVDSCLDDEKVPAAIAYLRSMGVAPETAVVSVCASHWHDDHVKGLCEIFRVCRNARLGLGSALRDSEFVAFLQMHEDQPVMKLDRGGTELLSCLRYVRDESRPVKALQEDTVIIDFDGGALAHGCRVEMRALSPSGTHFTEFLQRMGGFIECNLGQAKTRISEPSKNALSVAMLLTVGGQAVLLGADLEEDRDERKGWKAVVEARKGRLPKAHVLKVPHHGSEGAHNDDMWSEVLSEDVWSVVTPWNNGGKWLPKVSDFERLRGLSKQCYVTSTDIRAPRRRYPREVWKHIRAAGVELESALRVDGRVSIRWVPGEFVPRFEVSGSAAMV